MRCPEDLIKVGVLISSVIILDWERITQDSAWAAIADNIDLNDKEQREQALFQYLASYLGREQLFDSIFMPSTNGPATIQIEHMEDLTNGNNTGSTERNPS